MNYDITYEDIIDILTSNGVDLNTTKIELSSLSKKKRNLKLLTKSSLSNIEKKIKKLKSKNKVLNSVQIYTDGSCLENDSKHPGTFALVVVLNNKIIFEYSNYDNITTNNEMELSALIIASQIGQMISKLGIKTYIHSDSQYAVYTLFGTWAGKKNQDLQDLFKKLNVNKRMVNCQWIKAHDGNILNEYADKLCEIEYNKIKGYYVTRQN